jgi:dihydrofolate synthase/folylpolyglutamate synthase
MHSYEVKPDLKAEYQTKNLPGVMKVAELMNQLGFSCSEKHIREGLEHVIKNTGLFGRWQKLYDQPLTICDTVHNEPGVRHLVKQIEKIQFQQLHIIWGAVDGKDLRSIFNLLPKHAFYYFCEASIPRALKAEVLQSKAMESGLHGMAIKNVNDAISLAREKASEHDLIIIGGSNFLVAEITNLKGEEKAAKI